MTTKLEELRVALDAALADAYAAYDAANFSSFWDVADTDEAWADAWDAVDAYCEELKKQQENSDDHGGDTE